MKQNHKEQESKMVNEIITTKTGECDVNWNEKHP